jgi:hypothetical protein
VANRLVKPGRLAAAAALVLVVAGILLWQQSNAPGPLPVAELDTQATVPEPQEQASEPVPEPSQPEQVAEPPAAEPEPEPSALDEAAAEAQRRLQELVERSERLHERESAETEPWHVVLQFRDPHGNPVPHWQFKYVLYDRRSFQFQRRELVNLRRASAWDRLAHPRVPRVGAVPPRGKHGGSGVTDANGDFELLQGRDFPEGFELTGGTLYDLDQGMAFAPIRTNAVGEFTYIASGRERPTVVQVPVVSARTVTLQVRYEDGRPFSGLFGVAYDLTRIELSSAGSAELVVPDTDAVLNFYARGERQGFRIEMTWRQNSGDIPTTLELVIPVDEDQTTLIVNLAAWPSDARVNVDVVDTRGRSIHTQAVRGGEVLQTHTVPAQSGLRVVAMNRDSVWHSQEFELRAGETFGLTATPAATFAVTATIVSDRGHPVLGATMSPFPLGGVASQPRPTQINLYARFSGHVVQNASRNGRVQMTKLPVGNVTLHFAGPRHEPLTREVYGQAGAEIDLGDIKLAPARGRVTIRLLNHDPNVEYDVMLINATTAEGAIQVSSRVRDTVVIRNVPRRRYTGLISVQGRTGSGRTFTVEFEGDEATVEVDVGERPAPD